jgi:hypothetical protein
MFAAHAAPDDFVKLDIVGFVGSSKIHLGQSARDSNMGALKSSRSIRWRLQRDLT